MPFTAKRPPRIPPARATHAELLKTALALSGEAKVRFARSVLIRDKRTLNRYLTGEMPIPQVVVDFLEDYVARRTAVAATLSRPA